MFEHVKATTTSLSPHARWKSASVQCCISRARAAVSPSCASPSITAGIERAKVVCHTNMAPRSRTSFTV